LGVPRDAIIAALNDDKQLTAASRVFDGLYTNFQQEQPHD
jgi:hypothetical protein